MEISSNTKSDWLIAFSNTYGYLLATVGPTLIDPLLTTHMAYGVRTYKYGYLIWPIALGVFALTLVVRRYFTRTNVLASLAPLLVCSGVSLPIFYPEVPHMNVLFVTIMWSIITTFWLLSRKYLPEFSKSMTDEEISSVLSTMPIQLISNRMDFTRNLLFVIIAVTTFAIIAGLYLANDFNSRLVSAKNEVFYLTQNTIVGINSYLFFIIIGPIQELFAKYRILSNAKMKLYGGDGGRIVQFDQDNSSIPKSISQQFDIFISVKVTDRNGNQTEDLELAEEVYIYLKSKGFNVFLSKYSISEIGQPQYIKAIHGAIASASIFISVSMNPNNFKEKWIEYEWGQFLHKCQSHHKDPVMIVYYDKIPDIKSIDDHVTYFEYIKHSYDGQSLIRLHGLVEKAMHQTISDRLH